MKGWKEFFASRNLLLYKLVAFALAVLLWLSVGEPFG